MAQKIVSLKQPAVHVNYLNDFLPLRSYSAKTPLYQPSTNDPVSIRLNFYFVSSHKQEEDEKWKVSEQTKDCEDEGAKEMRKNACANCVAL